jgi:hypothetical protein
MPALPREYQRLVPKRLRGGWMPLLSDTALARRPRSSIIVDEWGPYDYRAPKLWPVDSSHAFPLRLRVLGPSGTWRLLAQRGIASLSSTSGRIGDTIDVTPKPESRGDWQLELEYVGKPVVTRTGRNVSAGVSYVFSYSVFEPAIAWTASFYTWPDSAEDPRQNPNAFELLRRSTPLLSSHPSRLDFEGYRALPGLPRENFALDATGWVDLPAGEYTLRTISDDAVRVWVDGVLAIDNWKPHESAVDLAPLKGGRHALRVEYYQSDGWYELRLDIVRELDPDFRSP